MMIEKFQLNKISGCKVIYDNMDRACFEFHLPAQQALVIVLCGCSNCWGLAYV